MKIEYSTFTVASLGKIPVKITNVCKELEPSMARGKDDTEQYCIDEVIEYLDVNSEEVLALKVMQRAGIEYIEI